ncbi:hypothetical protein ABFS82_12G160400 [Erythranthe guttata]|uniref:uncharacterized protein LOC105956847 n=1 Tax=Erythranthe guttata TaxID=4155 RepID=UPI00064DC0A5|nr:PREDICTED: uncharacterized protein LOC105956847 [Erythranthe guttata]|eukprot:XP_012836210.1 PREDICTED: uncharacterized protein LOC105956847 [Erythranthe guttata]
MRVGANCAAPQTLSEEAASALKHSLILARRRRHAQVTPLHVAATLLMTSSSSSLLRSACLKSQPHHFQQPLQCRALELCFNVALNRLPASPAAHLLHHHHAPPSLSNALVAALKRAQALNRRDCVEHQQNHPLAAVKIELVQLVLSILDDPSVSRVMREAGFSSTCVKTNLLSYPSTENPLLFPPQKPSLKQDMGLVLEVLMGKKRSRNIVIVGEDSATSMAADNLAAELFDKMSERRDLPDEVASAHVINFQFSSLLLKFMNRDEVDMNVADVRKKVESFSAAAASSLGGGRRVMVIVYIGDLKWTVDQRGNGGEEYSVNYLIAEIGKLGSWYGKSSNLKVCLMATANYQTYIKCQMKKPSLDIQWDLQTVFVPSGAGLGLSLNNNTSDRDAFPANNQNYGFAPRLRSERSCHNGFSFGNGINPEYQPNLDEDKISLTLGNSMHAYRTSTHENYASSVIRMKLVVNYESAPCSGIKRKADCKYRLPSNWKTSRKSVEMEEVSSVCGKREFRSSNLLDLNMKAEEEEDEGGEKTGDVSPVSSDLTRETMIEPDNMNSDAREMVLLSKLRRSFEEAVGGKNVISSFNVEEIVLEKIVQLGGGLYYGDSLLFDEWVRDVFQRSILGLGVVSVIRLCLDGENEISCAEDGFMGTCLPKRIHLSFLG